MQMKRILAVREYTRCLLKKYHHQVRNQANQIYRITEIKQTSSNQIHLVIQVIGKSVFITCAPQEILADDNMLEGFTKKDIRTITYLACEQSKRPKYKIIKQAFCDKFNKVLFRVKRLDNNETMEETANYIVRNKNLIYNFSQEDAHSISYTAGYEHSLQTKNEMDFAKNAN